MDRVLALSLCVLLAVATAGCGSQTVRESGTFDADAVREFHESNRITYNHGENGFTTPEGRDDIPVAPDSGDGSSGSQTTAGSSTGGIVNALMALSVGAEGGSFSGSGDDVFAIPSAGVPHIYRFTCEDVGGMFDLQAFDASGQSLGYIGQTTTTTTSGTFTDLNCHSFPSDIQVLTKGGWTVEALPVDQIPAAENGGSYTGPQVLYIDTPSISKITFRRDGGDYVFSAEAFSTANRSFTSVAYGNGAIDSTHVLRDPQTVLIVESWDNTPWTVSWE